MPTYTQNRDEPRRLLVCANCGNTENWSGLSIDFTARPATRTTTCGACGTVHTGPLK